MTIVTKDTFSVIQQDLGQAKGKHFAIIAGHYCIAEELEDLSSDGESEIHSFELGVKTFKYLKDRNCDVSLILWINDIGIDILFRKKIKEGYKLPENYSIILERYNIESSVLDIYFESSIRNRAMLEFRRIYKKAPERFHVLDSKDKSLVRCINNIQCEISQKPTMVYTVQDTDGSPIVMREGDNVKCNLILATLLHQIEKKYKSEQIIHVCNDIYIDRVRLGEHVAKEVYSIKSHCHSFFCNEDTVYKKNW